MSVRSCRRFAVATLLTAGMVAAPLVAVPAIAADGGKKLSATLTGAAEVPGPGDPDGTGTAHLRVNIGQMQICYDLTAMNIDPATAAHIHVGAADKAGPVVVGLSAPTGGMSSGCVSVDRQEAKDIAKNPEDYYVNVHNARYPGGAVRGQLG
jgi:hypothetical protein